MIYSHLLIQVRLHNHGAVLLSQGCNSVIICLGSSWRYFQFLIWLTHIVETSAATREKGKE